MVGRIDTTAADERRGRGIAETQIHYLFGRPDAAPSLVIYDVAERATPAGRLVRDVLEHALGRTLTDDEVRAHESVRACVSRWNELRGVRA